MSYSYPTELTASGLVSDTQGKLDSLINFFDLASEPTNGHILSYNSTTKKIVAIANSGGGGSGIALTDLSVSTNSASGNGSLAYDNTTGVFTFTPADTSGSGIALTDLSVSTASASGGGALAYNNSTGVFTFTPASPTGGSTFTDTIQAQGQVSIYASDGGQDGTATFAGPNLTLESTNSSLSSLQSETPDGGATNLALKGNKILLQGTTNKEIQNAQEGDIIIRTKSATDGTDTTISMKHDEERIEFNKPLLLHTATADPSSNLTNGLMYYNTTTNKFRGYANGSWTDLH